MGFEKIRSCILEKPALGMEVELFIALQKAIS
jgi:hypothetical protein